MNTSIYMKNKMNKFSPKEIKYTNEPIEARLISDFLPKPENLILMKKRPE